MNAWEGSTRADRLPDNWGQLRQIVLKRCKNRCEETMRSGKRCHDKATEVDHITPGDDHSLSNLQGLCTWHHARKTAIEGNDARTRLTQTRAPETHPGAKQ